MESEEFGGGGTEQRKKVLRVSSQGPRTIDLETI